MKSEADPSFRTRLYRGVSLAELVPVAAQTFKEMLWAHGNSATGVLLLLEQLCDLCECHPDAMRARVSTDRPHATERDLDIFMVLPFFLREYFAEAVSQLTGQPVTIPFHDAQNGFAQRIAETLLQGGSHVTFDLIGVLPD